MTIEDWNGNDLIRLGEGERAVFQITLEGGANGGTLLGIDIPDRRMSYFKTSPTESESWVVSDYPRWSNGSYRYSLVPISDTDSTDQLVIQDESIIRIPANTQPIGSIKVILILKPVLTLMVLFRCVDQALLVLKGLYGFGKMEVAISQMIMDFNFAELTKVLLTTPFRLRVM